MVSSAGSARSFDLARARAAGRAHIKRRNRSTCLFEWGLDPDADFSLERNWFAAVPTLGWPGGAQLAGLRDDFEQMDRVDFAREYLGVWTDDPLDNPVPANAWSNAQRPDLPGIHSCVVAVDTAPDQTSASIVVCGLVPPNDTPGIILVSHDAGDEWLEDHLERVYAKYQPARLVVDATTPANRLAGLWKSKGRPVKVTQTNEMSASCAEFVALLNQDGLLVAYDDALTAAAVSATRRPLSNGWAFNRRSDSTIPINPIVAAALAAGNRVASPVGGGVSFYSTEAIADRQEQERHRRLHLVR